MSLTGDGSTTTYAIPFLFVDRSDIQVYLNGVQTTAFSWTSTGFIQLNAAPATGTAITILRRTVADTGSISFNGGLPTPSLLQSAFRKILYIAQEALNSATNALAPSASGDWDALNRRITNVADPILPTDAVNFETMESHITSEAVNVTGDTMTGPLILAGDPQSANEATRRDWVVDNFVSVYGGTYRQDYTFNDVSVYNSPTQDFHLTRRDWVQQNTVAYDPVANVMRAGAHPIQGLGDYVRMTNADPTTGALMAVNQRMMKTDTVAFDPDVNVMRAGGRRITGVLDPVNSNDVVTLNFFNSHSPAGDPSQTYRPISPDLFTTANFKASELAYGDFHSAWFHFSGGGNYSGPCLRDTHGGIINDAQAHPTLWEMGVGMEVYYWRAVIENTPAATRRIQQNTDRLHALYTASTYDPGNFTTGNSPQTVASQDDAAWALLHFAHAYQVTGDQVLLDWADRAFSDMKTTFADPNSDGRYGLLYPPQSSSSTTYTSSAYEAFSAVAMVLLWRETGNTSYLDYAKAVWQSMFTYLRYDDGAGGSLYWASFILNPASADYRKPQGWNAPGFPIRGGSNFYDGGTLAMGALSGILYGITGSMQYLNEAISICKSFVRPTNSFVRTVGGVELFLNSRDPWDNGVGYPLFVQHALPLPGVDPSGAFASILDNTCARITANCRHANRLYDADWSGPDTYGSNGYYSWETDSAAHGNEGNSSQLMTNASTLLVLAAGSLKENRKSQRRILGV